MLAGKFVSTRKVELVEIDEPNLDGVEPGHIIFQPEMTCLCGSDLPFFDGDFEGHDIPYPQPFGKSLHEMVGTVVATNGTRWKPGQRVLTVPEEQMGLWERYVVSETRSIGLDESLSDEMAMLAQPFGTVVWALKKLPNMIDRDAVVLGLGPIGQMFVAGLRNMGARRIIGIDPIADRTTLALTMGATDVVTAKGIDSEEDVRRILGGQLADVTVEAVGHKAQASVVRIGTELSQTQNGGIGDDQIQAIGPDEIRPLMEKELRMQIDHNLDKGLIRLSGNGTFRYSWRGMFFMWYQFLKDMVRLS